MSRGSWALGVGLAAGCHREDPPGYSQPSLDTADTHDQGPVDTGVGPVSADWCDRVTAGPAGAASEPLLDLSLAHAAIRLFGIETSYGVADQALASALGDLSVDEADLEAYASGLTDVCVVPASGLALGPAQVEAVGDLAWVTPGTGSVSLPSGTRGVVVDLRDLAHEAGTEAAVLAAVGLALAAPVERTGALVQAYEGWPDQAYAGASNVYSVGRDRLEPEPIAPLGSEELPLWLVTGPTLAPPAAELALELRQAGRAWIVGREVLASVAESRWQGVGASGLAFRALSFDDWPDAVPADLETSAPRAHLTEADTTDWPALAPVSGEIERPALEARSPFYDTVSSTLDTATMRADLVTIHGALGRFWRYGDVVHPDLDARLLEVLGAVPEPMDRAAVRPLLGRLGEALHDGHVFFWDASKEAAAPAGYLPVSFDHLDGEPVVVRALVPELLPGDVLTTVDGTSVADLYEGWRSWHGAATEGYTLDLIGRELWRMAGTTTYGLRDPDGVERVEVIEPQPQESMEGMVWVCRDRASGLLTELGAGEVAYLNLDGQVTTSLSDVYDLIDQANEVKAVGLVVDMRGYPGLDHYAVAQALNVDAFASPWFLTNTWWGPDDLVVDEDSMALDPTQAHHWSGPIALLVSPVSVSAAENFSSMLVDRPDLTIVGRTSAGTNGNITGLLLPGALAFTFTGMEVRFPDGSTFHGVGLVPDVVVEPTAASYRDGNDPELQAAIDLLLGL